MSPRKDLQDQAPGIGFYFQEIGIFGRKRRHSHSLKEVNWRCSELLGKNLLQVDILKRMRRKRQEFAKTRCAQVHQAAAAEFPAHLDPANDLYKSARVITKSVPYLVGGLNNAARNQA